MRHRKSFGLALALILAAASVSYAEITVDPAFQGSLIITTPDGKTQVINAGDAIPLIVSGSTISVLDGNAEISAAEGEQVSCSCLGAQFDVAEGSSVKLICGTQSGSLDVLAGSAVVKSASGENKNLQKGDRFPIVPSSSELAADPTATGDALGITPPGDSEPNSRDMAVSPGQ